MADVQSDRASSVEVFQTWLESLPVSRFIAADGKVAGDKREKQWLDEITNPTRKKPSPKREKQWLDEITTPTRKKPSPKR